MVQVQYFGTGTKYDFEFYTSVTKWIRLKVRKFWGLIPTFVEVTGEKLIGGPFAPILNWVKVSGIFVEFKQAWFCQLNNSLFLDYKFFSFRELNLSSSGCACA